MSEIYNEKPSHSKCADAIEFGESFGKYSRISKFQFALTFDEKYCFDGFNYKVRKSFDNGDNFRVRIVRPNSDGIFLALWKLGKISFATNSSSKNPNIVEVIKK
mmetsp:Transcript_41979/g.65600  ORF Transcript_41979/g.65600 Transcript_41979/m.65600 type:complete len:104 (-) Transcript_41979:2574-2885(-)